MVRTNELRGIIAKNGYSQADVARMLGISQKTFYEKMKKRIFNLNEAQAMVDFLHIENPADIFFN